MSPRTPDFIGDDSRDTITEADLPDALEWTLDDDIWKSDPYPETMYVPFTRVEVEFGFVNGDPRTIEYDETKHRNPELSEVCGVPRAHYYQIGDAGISRDRSKYGDNQTRVVLEFKNTPELTVIPPNQSYEQVLSRDEKAAVVNAPIKEWVYEDGSSAYWTTDDVLQMELTGIIPRSDVPQDGEPYPTTGVFGPSQT